MKLPEHAENDAFVLRNRSVPDHRRQSIVLVHATEIERQARADREAGIWQAGQLPPKALLAAAYINAMFISAFRGRDIISPIGVAELFEHHQQLIRSGQIMSSSPLGYTALSSMSYAADRVQGVADPAGLQAYACRPAEEPLSLAS